MSTQRVSELPSQVYRTIRRRVEAACGIHLPEHKIPLIVGRLSRRLRDLGLQSFEEYVARIESDDREFREMLNCISTNETWFFREPQHFRFLQHVFIPQLAARAIQRAEPGSSLAIWSAGCATGEEPYSLAMTFADALPDWDVRILASDISTTALEHAQRGIYDQSRVRDTPRHLLHRYCLQGMASRRGQIKVGTQLRQMVELQRINLLQLEHLHQRFDIIFCRNVMIYFQAELRRHLQNLLVSKLKPGGLLFLGHAETLPSGFAGTASVVPTVYQRMKS